MKVEILKEIFQNNNTAHLRAVNYLLQIILFKHRYILCLSDPDIVNTSIFSQLHQTDKDAISQAIIYTFNGSYTADCTVQLDGDRFEEERKFDVEEAIMYLMHPISIIVENSLNDGRFLKALFRCFDPSNRLTNMFDNRWIQFENAGGCDNIKNFIDCKLEFYQNKPKFHKCFVLIDGDLTHPMDEFKHTSLNTYLVKYGIPYHILEKRMVENYVPNIAYDKWRVRNLESWIDAFLNLSEKQKDYFNIPVGFFKGKENDINLKKSPRKKRKDLNKKTSSLQAYTSLNKEIKNLYNDLSEGNFNHLKNGFKLPNFKTEFPKVFEDATIVYKRSLIEKTQHQQNPSELQEIVDKIMNLT